MEKVTKEIQEKIGELQLLQQRVSVFATQKQQIQLQLIEIENALAELEKASSPVFKLVGEILIGKEPNELKKELNEKKEDLDIRIKSVEKQENGTREKLETLQKELTNTLKT